MPQPLRSPESSHRWAVFLDRDGTIVEERVYLSDPEQLVLLPTAAEAIRTLNELGVPVFVVTNQAGVARGYFSRERVDEVHCRLDELLAQCGAHVNNYYVCPHHPDGMGEFGKVCQCRKPKPGLLFQARDDWQLDLAKSTMIGDKWLDLEAGWGAGCESVLVLTGYGREVYETKVLAEGKKAQVAETLLAAVQFAVARGIAGS